MLSLANARIGCVLRAKWRLDHVLGVGGMATVYAATHRNGKRGAVKILHGELSDDPEIRRRFLQEGYIANKVDHPGVVAILDDDVAEDGSVFIVMELLEGRTVEDLARGRMDAAAAMTLADQLLDVLAAAHEKGIVHRDLKPPNLFITHDGALKVLDFGIARVKEAGDAARVTKAGNIMGTPSYMPPEQALGDWEAVDGRADLWAAGATLFAVLTGRTVHQAPTPNQILLAAAANPAPAIRSILPDLPEQVAVVIDRALAYEPRDRWPDARSMQLAARAALQKPEQKTQEPPAPPVSGREPSHPPSQRRANEPSSGTMMSSSISHDGPLPRPRKTLGVVLLGGSVTAAIATVLVAIATAPAQVPPASQASVEGPPVGLAATAPIPTESTRADIPAAKEITAERPGDPPPEPKATVGARPRITASAPITTIVPSSSPVTTAATSARPASNPKENGDPFGKWE